MVKLCLKDFMVVCIAEVLNIRLHQIELEIVDPQSCGTNRTRNKCVSVKHFLPIYYQVNMSLIVNFIGRASVGIYNPKLT